MKEIFEEAESQVSDLVQEDIESLLAEIDPDSDFSPDSNDANIIYYVAGYISRSIMRKI